MKPAELLFRTIEPFIAELQTAIAQLETGKKDPVGHLRIGAPQDFGSTHLTEVIVEFHKKYPLITFELVLAIPVTLLEMPSENNLDMAFVDNGDFHAQLYPVSIVTVMKEKFVLVCSHRYFDEFIPRQSLKYEDLKHLNFIDYVHHAPVAKMWVKHHFGKSAPDLKAGRLKIISVGGRDLINHITLARRLEDLPRHEKNILLSFTKSTLKARLVLKRDD